MNLEVVTVGTELVLGHVVDTNAAELGRALAAAGVEVVRHTSVPDRPAAIRDAIADALRRSGLVLATGGLGPTRDDMTKRVVAELLDRPLALDPAVLETLEARFRRLGRPMPPINRTQAEVPRGATVLPNPRGTAPGLWIEDDRGGVVILLPGVPSEMRGLFAEEVLPRLVARQGTATRVVRSRTLRTTGVPESAVAERIGTLEDELEPLSLAYLPSEAGVDLRLTAWSLPAAEADARLAAGLEKLRGVLGDHCYGTDDEDLAAVVLDRLRRSHRRLAVVESCTGGLLGGRLTAIAGSSDVFVGGVIAYSNAVKTDVVGVPGEMVETHGAVSEPVVRALALGAQRLFTADAAIAITGIAGPGGGTADKPVGTVWLAVCVGETMRALKRVFPGARGEIRSRSAQAGLDLLRRQLEEHR